MTWWLDKSIICDFVYIKIDNTGSSQHLAVCCHTLRPFPLRHYYVTNAIHSGILGREGMAILDDLLYCEEVLGWMLFPARSAAVGNIRWRDGKRS